MRISDWSSDVCSSDLRTPTPPIRPNIAFRFDMRDRILHHGQDVLQEGAGRKRLYHVVVDPCIARFADPLQLAEAADHEHGQPRVDFPLAAPEAPRELDRSEEHTSELQSLMRTSYAVFCLKK